MASGEIHGTLLSLSEQTAGDAFDTAASSSATTLSLYDVSDFDEDGGSVLINTVVYAYDSVDMDADTIHLTSGLSAGASVDDRVDIWDPEGNVTVTERTALVTVDDQADGDPLTVEVDHSLAPMLVRETLSAGRSVSMIPDGSSYRMVTIHGKQTEALQRTNTDRVQWGLDNADGSQHVYGIEADFDGLSVRLCTGGDVRIRTPDRLTYMPILASAFTVSSDSALKTRPTAAPDALAIIKAAPAKCWRYQTDEKTAKRVGPMADDLPEWMQQVIEEEDGPHMGVDLARQNGLLWRAVEQLLERVEQLEKGE